MIFTPLPLAGSYTIALEPYEDNRGWFARYYDEKEFIQIGHTTPWVQMNHSVTSDKGTLRGMHYQLPPYEEVKLIRCIAGSVYDVIIDLRAGSPTLFRWYGITLSAEKKNMLYIPKGFAHGFQTLENNSELLYHHTAYYTPAAETGILYNDPVININWPLPVTQLSERDSRHPFVTDSFKGL
ncbi:MAG TPA: dTDP-4-dehydrorhamnose 3,5-epimerase [Flavitalea sp.]|nr:dTDP-4-dehydrorhamnose 3,5-epimerase [Flavitalea sp.]